LALSRRLQQLVVWNRVPEEKRQLRRKLEIRQRIDLAGPDVRRHAFAAIQEERTCEQPRQRAAHAAVESVLCALVVVLHQLVDVVCRHRPAVRALRERRDNRPRAFTRRLLADEDAIAAWRRAESPRVERTLKLERIHAVEAILSSAGREQLQL